MGHVSNLPESKTRRCSRSAGHMSVMVARCESSGIACRPVLSSCPRTTSFHLITRNDCLSASPPSSSDPEGRSWLAPTPGCTRGQPLAIPPTHPRVKSCRKWNGPRFQSRCYGQAMVDMLCQPLGSHDAAGPKKQSSARSAPMIVSTQKDFAAKVLGSLVATMPRPEARLVGVAFGNFVFPYMG